MPGGALPFGRGDLMGYAIVVVVAAAVGVAVYMVTVRRDRDRDRSKGWTASVGAGRAEPVGAGAAPSPGMVYVPVSVARRTWQTRLVGFLALLALMIASATVLAYSLVRLGAALFRLLAHKITSG